MTIREAGPDDHDAIGAVVAAAFADEPAVPRIVEELRTTRRMVVERVAVEDETVTGHVALSRGWVDDEAALVPVLVLSPLSVLPGSQGRGIGTRLLEAALAAARVRGEPYVFLEGSPAYYGSRGFEPASARGFLRPSDRIPAPAFQVAVLDDRGAWGRVVYPDAFWVHDATGLRGEVLERVRASLGE